MRLAGLFFLSTVVLAFEVFLTRLVSYTVDVVLIYVVLGIAMLGSGAAGSIVALRNAWLEEERVGAALATAAAAFTVSLVVAPAIFVRLTPSLKGPGGAIGLAVLLTAPFLASGVAVTLALASSGTSIGRVYAADLAGAALGCFLPLTFLGPLDGARFLSALVALSLVAAVLYFRAARVPFGSTAGKALIVAVAVGGYTLLAPNVVYPITEDPLGQANLVRIQAAARGSQANRVFDRWDPTGHIAVYQYSVPGSATPYPYGFYVQDGTAGSILAQWSGVDAKAIAAGARPDDVAKLCTSSIYSQGYTAPRDRVLIIGLGGGPDVQCALFQDAKHVDVVEINGTTVRAMTGQFSSFLGGIGTDPRVTYHVRDGRSFAHSSRGQGYKLIQLSGVDTKQVLASGALALNENHLYTQQALEDYLASLAPDGVLSIVRFGEPEQVRLINTAVHALKKMGVARPEQHIVAVSTGFIIGVLIRREPFPPEELAALDARFGDKAPRNEAFGPYFVPLGKRPVMLYVPDHVKKEPFASYFDAVARNNLAPFTARYPFKIAPTTDDRPFFFDLYPSVVPMSLLPFQIVYGLLAGVTILALASILLPALWIRRRTGERVPMGIPWFFACVGVGFLLVEVWLIHRFGIYLGHQTYAMSVVLGSLLVGTGFGAYFAERLFPVARRRIAVGIGGTIVLGALFALAAPRLLEATWALSIAARFGLVFALVFAIGFVMGFPFPTGLRWIGEHKRASLPWCIGINWFASVMASVAVTPLSMKWGYTLLAACGLASYAIAWLLWARIERATT